MAQQREPAQRLFATEFNAARVEIKGEDQYAPSYVVSPLGAKVNRLFVVGVLTDVENTGADGSMWKARISDPTGTFTLYSGQYQPEASQTLSELEPPQYVAVVGKSRTYEPEPGSVFVSIRPETITVVEEELRNQWVFDAAKATWDRIQAYKQAENLDEPTPARIEDLGVAPWVADGVSLARENYEGDVDVEFFRRAIADSLKFLESGEMIPDTPAAPETPVAVATPKVEGPGEEIEDAVLEIIQGFAADSDKGAQWDAIVAEGQKKDLDEDTVEEAINALMDKGLIYEPILGRLKVT